MAHLTWLHLSDLHFGNPKDTWDAETIRLKLLEDLHFLENEKGLRPDLLFFTGDLAFGHLGPGQSLTGQYKGAAKFLDAVRTAFKTKIPKDRVFLVPGNHDVNRSRVGRMSTMYIDSLENQDAISNFMAGNDDDWKRTMDRLADYRHFLLNSGYIHLLQDEHRLTYDINCQIRDLSVGVGGFNTVWSSGRNSAEERGKLCIGWKYQANRIEKEIRKTHIKIALFHHPLSWGCEADNTFADRNLRNQFHFILTGHEHRTMLTPYADGHADIASYACYHRTHGSGYNMVHLDFENGQGRVWLRKSRPSGSAAKRKNGAS